MPKIASAAMNSASIPLVSGFRMASSHMKQEEEKMIFDNSLGLKVAYYLDLVLVFLKRSSARRTA